MHVLMKKNSMRVVTSNNLRENYNALCYSKIKQKDCVNLLYYYYYCEQDNLQASYPIKRENTCAFFEFFRFLYFFFKIGILF